MAGLVHQGNRLLSRASEAAGGHLLMESRALKEIHFTFTELPPSAFTAIILWSNTQCKNFKELVEKMYRCISLRLYLRIPQNQEPPIHYSGWACLINSKSTVGLWSPVLWEGSMLTWCLIKPGVRDVSNNSSVLYYSVYSGESKVPLLKIAAYPENLHGDFKGYFWLPI